MAREDLPSFVSLVFQGTRAHTPSWGSHTSRRTYQIWRARVGAGGSGKEPGWFLLVLTLVVLMMIAPVALR
jgi:hypothetical protein